MNQLFNCLSMFGVKDVDHSFEATECVVELLASSRLYFNLSIPPTVLDCKLVPPDHDIGVDGGLVVLELKYVFLRKHLRIIEYIQVRPEDLVTS